MNSVVVVSRALKNQLLLRGKFIHRRQQPR